MEVRSQLGQEKKIGVRGRRECGRDQELEQSPQVLIPGRASGVPSEAAERWRDPRLAGLLAAGKVGRIEESQGRTGARQSFAVTKFGVDDGLYGIVRVGGIYWKAIDECGCGIEAHGQDELYVLIRTITLLLLVSRDSPELRNLINEVISAEVGDW